MFLANGLGYVPTQKVDKQDLKYDTEEFIRKLEWVAFFKANPELQGNTDPADTIHRDIKVSNFSHPGLTSPLLEEVKTKLYGWIANHTARTPTSNLSPMELRGRKWLRDQIKNEKIFITKADKGGATLIMNFDDVISAIERELFDVRKFEELEKNSEEQLAYVKQEVKSLAIQLEKKGLITDNDKTLISGLNSNNRPKLAPEYQPESPYPYPLFKIHKLSNEDITNKKIPPSRLVHASKFSPLYRMEKWTSPYLTTISRDFCKDEFILDTGNLISNLEKINESGKLQNENVHLFTLDVQSLYPSIQPDLALQAIRNALSADTTTDNKLKTVIESFIKLSFKYSYVSYKNDCYKSKIGIPTGGSLSRQIADIFLHWIMFVKMTPKLSAIPAIRFWERFIDDCIGVWRGTKRSFDIFVKQLNAETSKYGILFPVKEVQFGKSIHFLDLCVYLDQDNTLQYRGYSKPTDSKRYLNPNSFHPASVFNSIPFSQMLRTIRNNSKKETMEPELEECVQTFRKSGYNSTSLEAQKQKAINKSVQKHDTTIDDSETLVPNNNTTVDDNETSVPNNNTTADNSETSVPNDDTMANGGETLVFPIHYFEGVTEFKSVVRSLDNEIKELIGDTKIMFAMRKRSSIGNMLVRNKQLSFQNEAAVGQKCNARGCRQCPLVIDKQKVTVNGVTVNIPHNLNCKTRNIIYLWLCKLCAGKEAYFGRTTQECHDRTSGHRGSFQEDKWEKSALSMHARDVHQTNFSLDNFSVAVVKKVSPQRLRREEYKFIDKFRTNSLGLNRYKS